MKAKTYFFKGPITACVSLQRAFRNYVVIGYGPFLSLIDDTTYNEISQYLALKYRVIHKIIKCNFNPNYLCAFGQKAFVLIEINEHNQFVSLINIMELDDWIFDIFWLNEGFLIIICAHNQCILFDLKENKVSNIVYCDQKCMLYSAKIISLNENKNFDELLTDKMIASGTIYNQILLWNPKNGSITASLEGHQGVIFNIDFCYENSMIFSVSDDRSINVWKIVFTEGQFDKNASKLSTRFYGHSARVWKCCSFIEPKTNIHYLISIGEDLSCCIWNVSEKFLVNRFNAVKKGSKNIWSVCVNLDKLIVYTGWADGSIRRFELKNYLTKQNKPIEPIQLPMDQFEWTLKNGNEKDFIRNILLLNKRIICCTNMGSLILIETKLNENSTAVSRCRQNQKFILKEKDLENFNVMAAKKLNNDNNKWFVAIGTVSGSIFLLDITFMNEFDKNQINITCFKPNIKSFQSSNQNSFKVCNIIWYEYEKRNFLLACFSFLDGLIHLYELVDGKLLLMFCLQLPNCKHRWVTSYSLIINNQDYLLICGDKCGNLYLFKLPSNHPNQKDYLFQPEISFKSLTNQNSSISAIYSKSIDGANYLIILCCKDGWYRLFELNLSNDYEKETIDKLITLKLINKYQISSFIDIIESFLFESDLKKYSILSENEEQLSFSLENSLKLATCFYGDKFLLWSFQLNRALFECQCGGANRSWGYELYDCNENILLHFASVSNKSIQEISKLISKTEIQNPIVLNSNHFFQLFHGNTITVCKYLNYKYIFTGSEDTQVILTRIDDSNNKLNVNHQIHLQGHDSVVKCIRIIKINQDEILLVSAGGKANIKIWKILCNSEQEVIKIIHLYEFKRIRAKKESDDLSNVINKKLWLCTDLNSNPDIRFMDFELFKKNKKEFTLCFVCSDGLIRVFSYNLETNKLNLTSKYTCQKCLLCVRILKSKNSIIIITCGTDGSLLFFKINESLSVNKDEIELLQTIKNVHQSGINGIAIWQETDLNQFLIATVGDDACLSVLRINVDLLHIRYSVVKKEMAHASSIADVKFLNKNYIITVSKDQRLNLWTLDSQDKLMVSKQIFFNIADASSIDSYKTGENTFKIAIVGVGIQIIDIKLD